MANLDSFTFLLLFMGFIFIVVLFILLQTGKLQRENFKRALPIGTMIISFVVLMMSSLLFMPISRFIEYTVTNLLISIVFGVVVRYSVRMIP